MLEPFSQMQADPAQATKPGRDYILPITVFAALLRAAVALFVARTLSAQWLFSQATELGCMANSVLHHEGLASPFCGHTGPSAFLAPGYPLFVATVFRIFGPYTMRAAVCIVCTQAVFGTALIPVAMWTAHRAFGRRAANLTGFLCAVNPWLIGLEAVLWETSLSILFLTLLMGLAVKLQQGSSRRWWYAAALVFSAALMVNPSLVLAALALFVTVVWVRTGRRGADWLGPLALCIALCCSWPIRNARVLHAFVPLRSNMGYELWQGNRPGADGFFQAKLHPNANMQEFERYASLGEMAYMHEKSGLATGWIRSHPQRFAMLTAKRAASFWFGIGRTPSALLILSTTFVTLFGVGALGSLFRRNAKLAALFAVPLLVLPLPYYITHPDFRFWCLLAPILTMLSSSWIAERFRMWREV